MKKIFLVRHAKSYWGDQSLSDFDRPLNKRGKNDAPFMGKILKEISVQSDLIISSPAKRAKKTALAIAHKIDYPQNKILFNEELYEASTKDILKVLKEVDEVYRFVMLFGHNPGLTLLNNFISNSYIDNIPTCGVVALEFDKNWMQLDENSCTQLFFEYPKLYKQ